MTTFGPEIAVDGKRPEWLTDSDPLGYRRGMSEEYWYGPDQNNPQMWTALDIEGNEDGWLSVTAIRLPEYHPQYFPQPDTITLPRMTEEEAVAWLERNCSGHTGYPGMLILRSLNLIRPESRAERFTRETGIEVTGDVLKALEWERE